MKKRKLAAIMIGIVAFGVLGGCAGSNKKETIRIAASAVPHAQILEQAKPLLGEQGFELEITVFEDYILPNEVVESGEFDANYFQHNLYLENFNAQKGTNLVSAAEIHYEPFGIYPGTKKELSKIETGDVIVVPNDTTNEARALLLLQENGIIRLKEGAGLYATAGDIAENPYGIEIKELEAAQAARVTSEAAYVVMNGNYAMQAGLSPQKDAIAYEKPDSEKSYRNIIAVRAGSEESEKIKALRNALKSETIKQYIKETYGGAVIFIESSM